MKKYKEYMDTVEASDAFQQRLKELNAPKRPAAWRKYGALAAALVLVVGVGAFGLSRLSPNTELGPEEMAGTVEIAPAVDPSLDDPSVDGMLTGGGYEIISGEVAAYYILPYIEYQDEAAGLAADYSIASLGALSREANWEDVWVLCGGPYNAEHHLGWTADLNFGGVVWFEENSPCAACIYGANQEVAFSVELMVGGEIPDCVRLPEDSYVTTQFGGITIRGLKNCGYRVDNGVEMRESRKVSFYANGIGCKMTIYGLDGAQVEELAARFVRWGILEGFDLSDLAYDHSIPRYDGTDTPSSDDEAMTLPYDPSA